MSLEKITEDGILDWNDLVQDPDNFKDNLIKNFRKDGFIIIDNSPLSNFRETVEEATQNFFKQPKKLKETLSVENNDNEGFDIPKKTDKKEYYHLGRHTREALKNEADRTVGYLDSYAEKQAQNLKINFKFFNEVTTKHFDLGVEVCEQILTIFEESLGLEKGALVDRSKYGNHISRHLYYPSKKQFDDLGREIIEAKPAEEEIREFRAKAHGDLGLLTAIDPAKEPGLQLAVNQPTSVSFGPKSDLEKIPNENWKTILYKKNRIVIHAGHQLTALTNGFIPSTIHRVTHINFLLENFPNVGPEIESEDDKPRYASPFFLHANPDEKMTAIPEMVAMRDGINLFENGKNITVKQYVEAQNEFDPEREISIKGEHPNVFLKKHAQKNTLA